MSLPHQQVICDLAPNGRASSCRIVRPQPTADAPDSRAKRVNWDETDPVTFNRVTLIKDDTLADRFPTEARTSIRVIQGSRMCRGIYEAIFINRQRGFSVPVMIESNGIAAKGFMRLLDIQRNVLGASPNMIVAIDWVTDVPGNVRNGATLLASQEAVRVRFLALVYELKRYIYEMNTKHLDTCFSISTQALGYDDLRSAE